MRSLTFTTIAVLTAAVALAGCGKSGTSGGNVATTANNTIDSAVSPARADPNAALLAAAEPFEALTETAFTATPPALDAAIAEVRTAAARVRGDLPAAARTGLDERLAAIASARGAGKRADLAIAAVEGYRILVSGASGAAKVPMAVNLLDYAGFRYDADLKAKPVRWTDMSEAVSFGREQWASISPGVTDRALSAGMETSLKDMAAAASTKNPTLAAASAQRELALVDDLETFFNARHSSRQPR